MIRALVGVSNFVILPSTHSRIKSLGISGRYIYLGLHSIELKNFIIHFDYNFSRSKNCRISLSNRYKEEKYKDGDIRIPLVLPKDKWVIVCLDPMQYFKRYHCMKDEEYFLRSLMFCDNIKVSRVGVSNNLYDYDSLPRDINFKFIEDWPYLWIEPIPCHQVAVTRSALLTPSYPEVENLPVNEEIAYELVKDNEEVKISTLLYSMTKKRNMLLEVKDIIGCSLNYSPNIYWLNNNEFIYTTERLIVISDLKGNKRVSSTHLKPIKALTKNPKGTLIVSATEDTVSIWVYETLTCIQSWSTIREIKNLAMSHDYLLALEKVKDMIIVFDLNGEKLDEQASEFGVCSIKTMSDSLFCAYSPKVASLLRIKNGKIIMQRILVNELSANEKYTAMDISGNYIYLGSDKGTIIKFDTNSYKVENTYRMNDSIIHTLSVNDIFCAIGTGKYLRIWPLEFTEHLLEVKHDGSLLSTDANQDKVLCGIDIGMIGVLDINLQQYATMARGHLSEVVCLLLTKDMLVSGSEDKTIRLWNVNDGKQVYEFKAENDQVMCMCLCPSESYFACGFHSGLLRIFSLKKFLCIAEYQLNKQPLTCIKYIDNYLLTLTINNTLSIYNNVNYTLIKLFPHETSSITATNTIFATASLSSIKLWAINPIAVIYVIPIYGPKVYDVVFLSEDSLLVFTSDSCLRLYSTKGQLMYKQNVIGVPSGHIKLIPSPRYIAFIGLDDTVRICLSPLNAKLDEPIEIEEYYEGRVRAGGFCLEDESVLYTGGSEIIKWKIH